jgi:UDP-glucose 4-epimerase
MMKVLVTGGAGFIGSNLVDELIKENEVVVIDNLSTGNIRFVNKKARFYNCDVTNGNHVKKVFEIEKNFDYIFHLAAQVSVPDSVKDPAFDAGINILGILNLLKESAKIGLKKFIFSSSGGAIYGEADVVPTPEEYPIIPISPYGISKYVSEKYLYFFKREYGVDYTILRYANIYGPRQGLSKESGVISIFVQKFVKGETPVIFGDGSAVRDYVYVRDVVKANILAMTHGSGEAVNISTSEGTTVNELFEKLNNIFGRKQKAVYGKERPGDIHTSILDNSKAKEVLDWVPEYSLENGLKDTVKFFEEV